MRGSSLGEFEEVILLTVASLFDAAYGASIQEELKTKANRKVTLSTIHVALVRLESKGLLESRFDGATHERGGRRKHLYRVTKLVYMALKQSWIIRNQLWETIPEAALTKLN